MTEKRKKYWEVNSYAYQKEVIGRLKRQKKIWSIKEKLFKILALTWVFLDETKLKYIADIGFIKDTQESIFATIAVKVKKNQINFVWIQWANEVWGDQFNCIWIQWANKVWGYQINGIWIQWANKVLEEQVNFVWIQWTNEVLVDQINGIWIQWANEVWGDQFNFVWIQWVDEVVWGYQTNIFWIQWANKVWGNQINIFTLIKDALLSKGKKSS